MKYNMSAFKTNFDSFADQYNMQIGLFGDFNHNNNVDPSILKFIGNVENLDLYDIGCGNGYLDFILSKKGARKIYASDISEKLIKFAVNRSKNESSCCEFFVSEGTDFSYLLDKNINSIDIVFSNLSLHYIENIDNLIIGIKCILKKGSKVVFTIAHPFDDLNLYKENANIEQIKNVVQSYLNNYSHEVVWYKKNKITIFKRPINFYINKFLSSNFSLIGLEELPRMYSKDQGINMTTVLPGFITYCFQLN
jgi:SAM-dependent methyltransferase